MKVDELTQNDKNMDFKLLNIQKELQDGVMEFFQFKEAGHMFESGVLVLQTLAVAAKQGATKLYFAKVVDGKQYLYEFDFLKLIEYIKDPNRPEGSTHGITINEYGNKDKAGGADNSAGPDSQ